jgi:signal transduction histidine kinase
MVTDPIADLLRIRRDALIARWERAIGGRGPALRAHVDHLLAGLASWIEGRREEAAREFAKLVDSPELQSLGYGVGLETLVRECGELRLAILREALARPANADDRESLLAMHEGMDCAIADATARFAQQREDVRDRFIGILGHDLRDPLASVTIIARVLGRHPKLRTHADRIEEACDRMLRMVNDVLDFARGQLGGGIPARPSPNDLGELCRTVASELGAAHPDRELALELTGDLHADVDRDRVMQALANLISNAFSHGVGRIEVRAHPTHDGDAIATAVTSHGAQIPSRELARIFDPFARAEAALDKPGLGLGLYIVQQIALAHGARCEVTSGDAGTTFSIRWPRAHSIAHRRAG